MGDVCGIGPEVIVKALSHSSVYAFCRPLVIGDADVLAENLAHASQQLEVRSVGRPRIGRIPLRPDRSLGAGRRGSLANRDRARLSRGGPGGRGMGGPGGGPGCGRANRRDRDGAAEQGGDEPRRVPVCRSHGTAGGASGRSGRPFDARLRPSERGPRYGTRGAAAGAGAVDRNTRSRYHPAAARCVGGHGPVASPNRRVRP